MGVPTANVKVETVVSGKTELRYPVFRTLEERCNACEIYGGRQRPCQPRAILNEIWEEHGRPCPRVLLELGNVEAWELWPHALGEAQLLPTLFPLVTAALSDEDRLVIFRRVMSAARDPRVQQRLAAIAAQRRAEEERKKRDAATEAAAAARARSISR